MSSESPRGLTLALALGAALGLLARGDAQGETLALALGVALGGALGPALGQPLGVALGDPLGQEETSRGLENKTPREFRPRVKEIREIIGFVLEEQSRFFTPVNLLCDDELLSDDESELDGPESTFTNDEYLAAIYRYYNKKHVVEAIQLAAIDAKEIYGEQ